MSKNKNTAQSRGSQKERSERMKTSILEATLQSIGNKSFRDVSLQDIADKADVSRGAITHHFPSKQALCAEAIEYFIRWRLHRLMQAFEEKTPRTTAERLDVLWLVFQDVFPVTFEIIAALRSDAELLELTQRQVADPLSAITEDYQSLFPVFSGIRLPQHTLAMIMAFYRGLCFEALTCPPEFIEATKAEFESLLAARLQQQDQIPDELACFLTEPLQMPARSPPTDPWV